MRHIKIALIICMVSIGCSSYAQYFSNLYIEGRPSMLFGSIHELNGKLYVTGVTTTTRNSNYQKAVFGKLSNTGSPIFINSIVDSDSYDYDIFYNSLKPAGNGNFITTGYITDSMQKAFLMKIDSNGQILLWHEYTETGNLTFQGQDAVEITDSGYLIAVNIERDDYVSSVLIIRTDTLGNVMEEHNYNFGQQAWPSVIRAMFNGHYMVGAFGDEPGTNTPYWAKTWLIETDRMGAMIRNWKDSIPKNIMPNGMEQTADSGWIITRQHLDYDISNFQAFDGSILKLDKDFNKEWEIDTGGIAQDAGMYDVKILNDGSYICVGANPIDINQDSSHIYGWLMKISQDGQIIWQRFYLADSTFLAFSYLNSVALMPDGGFAACGKIESNDKGQQGWIIRTDSSGCLLDNCGREVTAIDNTPPPPLTIKCYPNPTTDYLTVETPGILLQALLQVTDNLGRVILQQSITSNITPIQLGHQPAGIYFVTVNDGNGGMAVNKVVVMH